MGARLSTPATQPPSSSSSYSTATPVRRATSTSRINLVQSPHQNFCPTSSSLPQPMSVARTAASICSWLGAAGVSMRPTGEPTSRTRSHGFEHQGPAEATTTPNWLPRGLLEAGLVEDLNQGRTAAVLFAEGGEVVGELLGEPGRGC